MRPWSGPHAQTLLGKALRRRSLDGLRRERWTTPDGDFLDLDFTADPDPARPLAVVLHGLEGNSRRGYCLEAYAALAREDIAAVGVNFRACSGEPNLRARAYHSGETGDLAFVLEGLRDRFPNRVLLALGYSLGGNVLLK
ncbi:MAG: hydrolase, partial [Gemmatimonadetes bacterium]|nr:hydrolase [Gemmatimonadota bacterium]